MRSSFLLLVLFFAIACKNKSSVPSGILPQKKMQTILWDIMRADQFLSDYVLNKDSSLNATTESLKYYQHIFILHKVSREEFQHSFSFYKSKPALLKAIMDSISTLQVNSTPAKEIEPVSITAPINDQPDTLVVGPRIQKDSIRKRKRPLPAD
ncbi:MAG: DUF4296 domain-containing protein [Chitinophagaceae bacterium]